MDSLQELATPFGMLRCLNKDHQPIPFQTTCIALYFKDEWRNDEAKLRIFIKIHIGNFLPSETDTFGTYLSRLRHFKGMSNVELAKRTGLTEQTISKYLHDAGRTKESTVSIEIKRSHFS